jgi:hypothetical protein
MRRTLRERRALQDRPWEENLLHWAKDGTLHGTMSPPSDGRRRSVTSDGWCPAWGLEVQRRYLGTFLGSHHDESPDPVREE